MCKELLSYAVCIVLIFLKLTLSALERVGMRCINFFQPMWRTFGCLLLTAETDKITDHFCNLKKLRTLCLFTPAGKEGLDVVSIHG